MDSLAAIREVSARADRIEYCSNLAEDGLTPDLLELERAVELCDVPVFAMIRPRPGNFVHAAGEIDRMERSIEPALAAGAKGLVFGALLPQGRIDEAAMTRLLAACAGTPVTFHRAFDQIGDKFAALEILVQLGVSRVLTTGGPPRAWEGREVLRDLVRAADGRLVVMPGGGVRQEHVHELVEFTGALEVHSSVALEFPPPRSGRTLSADDPT